MLPELPLDASAIREHLTAVAEELGSIGDTLTIIVVGGALLALQDLRDATTDVDCVTRLTAELKDAVVAVAARYGLATRWLNDAALPFLPANFDKSQCSPVFSHLRLVVLGVPLEQIFLMKLYGARTRDIEDLIAIWSSCQFESPDQVVSLFRDAYPHAPEDEFLAQFIVEISQSAALHR
jgi:Nucleotidyltransferase of unknown function (DUF6036)